MAQFPVVSWAAVGQFMLRQVTPDVFDRNQVPRRSALWRFDGVWTKVKWKLQDLSLAAAERTSD